MAAKTGAKSVADLFHPTRFKVIPNIRERMKVENLPEAYQKFYEEWRVREPEAVHWIPREEKWERNPETGEVKPVQNCPIPVKYPHQSHQGIWGGEGVVQGLVKKAKYRSPVPRFWVPELKESVLYSEIFNKYFKIIVTERTLRLVDEHDGFDKYLLETPACDLQSLLALKMKRKLLLALLDKDFAHDNPKLQESLYEKYKQFIVPREEAEWYGLSVAEAMTKWQAIEKKQLAEQVQPLKHTLRMELLQKLTEEQANPPDGPDTEASKTRWLSKLNPFRKPEGAETT